MTNNYTKEELIIYHYISIVIYFNRIEIGNADCTLSFLVIIFFKFIVLVTETS